MIVILTRGGGLGKIKLGSSLCFILRSTVCGLLTSLAFPRERVGGVDRRYGFTRRLSLSDALFEALDAEADVGRLFCIWDYYENCFDILTDR